MLISILSLSCFLVHWFYLNKKTSQHCVSNSASWPWTSNLLSLPTKCWDYRCAPLYLALFYKTWFRNFIGFCCNLCFISVTMTKATHVNKSIYSFRGLLVHCHHVRSMAASRWGSREVAESCLLIGKQRGLGRGWVPFPSCTLSPARSDLLPGYTSS